MDKPLKQRLIGAAVLVLLAVIFLPMIVTGPAPDSNVGMEGVPSKVPPAPAVNVDTRDVPLTGPTADVTAPSTTVIPVAAAPATVAASSSAAIAASYGVTFGSYKNTQDAQAVVDALQGAGLQAQFIAAKSNGATVQRVWVGPYGSKDAAAVGQTAALKVNKVNTSIVAWPGTSAPEIADSVAASSTPAEASVEPAAKSKDAGPFTVQLGTFEDSSQAQELHSKAAAAGFKTLLLKGHDSEGRPITRVRTSPLNTRAEAETLKAQLAQKLGQRGQIQRL